MATRRTRRNRRNRTFACFQHQAHRAESAALQTENAALEGQLSAALGLDVSAVRARVEAATGGYCDPWERNQRLLALAAQAGA